MADDMNKLMVLIEANTKAYENAMKKIQMQTDKAMKGAASSTKVVDITLKQIETGAGRVGASIARMEADLGKAAMDSVGRMKLNNQQLGQMQFQLQDLGVQLASGQSPFMAIIQQGSQIGQMFGPTGSVSAALRATGAGIVTFVSNPINLAIIGFAAAAAVAPKIWEAFTGPEARKAEDTLKSLDDLLGDLEKSYEGVGKAAREMMDAAQSGDVLLAGIQKTENELRAGLARAIEDATLKTIIFTDTWGRDVISDRWKTEIESLGQQLKDGTITVEKFRNEIAGIRLADNAPESVKRLADNLLDATEEARKLENALVAAAATSEVLGRTMVKIDVGRFDQESISALERLADLRDKLKRQGDDITGPKPTAEKKSPAEAQREREIRTIEREQQAIADLLDSLRLEGEMIGMNALEREKALAVQRLGLSATDAQIAAVERQIETNYRLKQSIEIAAAAQDFLGRHAMDAFDKFVEGTFDAREALAELAKDLARMAAQKAIMNALGMLFGVPASGSSSPIDLLRPMANGGPASARSPYIVGEKGPELFVPKTAGQIVPNHEMRQAGSSVQFAPVINVDARGAGPGVGNEVRAAIREELDGFSRYRLPGRVREIQQFPNSIG